MKIWHHKYSLKPLQSLSSVAVAGERHGALLKILWPDGKCGYGDLYPWPEFGDQPLDEHINALFLKRITNLVEQSIWLARRDAKARALNQNFLQAINRVKNHYIITDITQINESKLADIKASGFSTLKIKAGRDIENEIEFIKRTLTRFNFLFRIDFNAKGDLKAIEALYTAIPHDLREKIEFIEDPMPYSFENWSILKKYFNIAVDFEADKVDWSVKNLPIDVMVIKPARQDIENAFKLANEKGLKIVITSVLDHSVGVVHANRIAAEAKRDFPHLCLDAGCATTRLYEPNTFTSRMIWQGPYLIETFGSGVGFDEQLEKAQWTLIE
jgi:o-succinylbenzoate synthase